MKKRPGLAHFLKRKDFIRVSIADENLSAHLSQSFTESYLLVIIPGLSLIAHNVFEKRFIKQF